MVSSSIQNEQKWGEAFTIYFKFIWFGSSPCSIVISSFNSYYQNSKNQEKNINLVVAETGEVALLSSVQAFPEKLLEKLADILLLYLFHEE